MLSLKTDWDEELEASPFSPEEVERYGYYLTSPNSEEIVKLGKKFTLKNGEQYGQIIAIPFSELKKLITEIENGREKV